MRPMRHSLPLIIAIIAFGLTFVHASPAAASGDVITHQVSSERVITARAEDLDRRDGHGHHNAHVAPLLKLNETEVTMYHAPTPPSYWTIDIEEQSGTSGHPGLMIMHGVLMSLAFFIALPVGRCTVPLSPKSVCYFYLILTLSFQ